MFVPIAALATAPLTSALAIVRVSGDGCLDIASKCFSKDLGAFTERTVVNGFVKDGDRTIDEAVCIVYRAPKSYTGEDAVEFIVHGSLVVANELLAALFANGAREAKPGEFTERAYLNRKMDLVQAESVDELIKASTKEGKDLALMSLRGLSSQELLPLTKEIGDLLALIEVNIDFPEYEDIEQANSEKVVSSIQAMLPLLDELLAQAEKGRMIVSGVSAAIIGKPNVGKSSLLNALINEDKAIVTDVPGTTRDIVEGSMVINGIPIRFYDTAGIRESADKVEAIGIKKAREAYERADIVIVVLDATDHGPEDEDLLAASKDKKRIVVYNKSDILKEKGEGKLFVSALEKDIEPLKKAISDLIGISPLDYSRPALTSAREIGLLKQARTCLISAVDDASKGLAIDLVSSSLVHALGLIKSITGEDPSVDIEKEIFSRFCVGK